MKNKPEKNRNYLSDSAIKFLKTKEGNRFFSEITGIDDRRRIFEQKKSFLEVPANVRRWLHYRELIEEKAKE